MNRYHILIEYVGTNFIGWQIQLKGKSIQKLIQIKIYLFDRLYSNSQKYFEINY